MHFSRMKTSDKVSEIVIMFILLLVTVITLYPFLNVLAIAFNESRDTLRGGITIYPRVFTIANFKSVLSLPTMVTGFINSLLRTVIGTVLSVLLTSMVAFTLSQKHFVARKLFNILLVITMYVSGGLIPSYLLMRNLHLFNNFLVYILPGLVWAWCVFINRSFIETLPYSMQESALIDGANELQVYGRIILPLSLPSLATIALYYAVGQWNSWFDTYLYCSSVPGLTTLQYELQKVLASAQGAMIAAQSGNNTALINVAKNGYVSPTSVQMAITIVVVVPIILVYPFLQRFFISGMTLGAVKG